MDDDISSCIWPVLAEPYASALKQAVAYILNRFQPVGIIASGSILRGNPGPSSDLDIYVIHTQPWRQRVQKFFNGVPAEIFVNPPKAVLGYFEEEQKEGRLITAHMLSTGFVVLNRGEIIEQLRQQARDQIAAGCRPGEADLMTRRYMIACRLEDGMDVASDDPALALMFLNQAIPEMLGYCFLERGRPIPRTKELLVKLAQIEPDLAFLANQFYLEPDPARRIDLAQEIARLTIGVPGFFEWETQPEEV